MTANERLLRYDQEGVIQEEAKQPPRRTPAPGVQFFIYGPRLPWVDETKLKGVRPEEAFEGRAQELEYDVGDDVAYPGHGVGRVEALETHSIAGIAVQVYVIRFETERMTLKVPVVKARKSGLRKLSSRDRIDADG